MADNNTTNPNAESPEPQGPVAGFLAEFPTVDALKSAAAKVREAGYRRWDTHTPYPVHGLDRAMGVRPTILPWLVLGAGITGGLVALGLQWYANAYDYPLIISGKPLFSIPANIPVTFELIVLFSALTAFFGALALSLLPQFWHGAFSAKRFAAVTADKFFVSIDAADKQFDEAATGELLESLGATSVEICRDPATGRDIPAWLYWAGAVVVSLALLPPLWAAWMRAAPSGRTRIHFITDMDYQPKFKAQTANPFFAASDGRAMRLPVPGTVAQGELREDDHLYLGKVDGQWAKALPESISVDMATMERGRERFRVFCATCHGLSGAGDGMTAIRAAKRQDPKWVPPLDLSSQAVREQEVGSLFNTITHGVRNMPAYGSQIPPDDRWAIVLYLRALQRSQHARESDVPQEILPKVR